MSVVLPPDRIGTGPSVSPLAIRYSFVAPSDDWIQNLITGLLWGYSQPEVWYPDGALTVDDCAEIFTKVWATLGVDLATTGAIVPYAGGILPSGWLVCDGSSLDRVTYANLFAAIGTVWGAVDGAHFNIPDLRGRTLVGQGIAGSGTTFGLGSYGGEEQHQLTVAELASHQHSTGNSILTATATPPPLDVLGPNPFPAATGFTGGDVPHNNLQPYAVVNYAIIT